MTAWDTHRSRTGIRRLRRQGFDLDRVDKDKVKQLGQYPRCDLPQCDHPGGDMRR